ncbi:MAG: hypothetical protein NTW21_40440 [Verrucomicrobia bacterium]|nr:hypothetical protein [Verrucomicrobiota bacterium]
MPSPAPSPVALPPLSPQSQSDLGDLVEACLDQTAEALIFTRAASQVEVSHAVAAVRKSQAEGRPLDLMEAVAREQGHQEEQLGGIMRSLGERLAANLNPSPQLIPFAGKLIAPSAFYESFDHLHKIARALLTPVVFVEDTDSIGVASVNPIAATILAAKIQEQVSRRFDIRPFLTIARLDYEAWAFLTHKHFEL